MNKSLTEGLEEIGQLSCPDPEPLNSSIQINFEKMEVNMKLGGRKNYTEFTRKIKNIDDCGLTYFHPDGTIGKINFITE